SPTLPPEPPPPVLSASSEIELQADAEQQCSIHRRESRMEHLQFRREVAPGSDPQVVEELDAVLVPEAGHQVLDLRAEPEIVEPAAKRISLPSRERAIPAEGDAQEPADRVRIAVAEARLDVQAQAPVRVVGVDPDPLLDIPEQSPGPGFLGSGGRPA